jgi:hypothetical protein
MSHAAVTTTALAPLLTETCPVTHETIKAALVNAPVKETAHHIAAAETIPWKSVTFETRVAPVKTVIDVARMTVEALDTLKSLESAITEQFRWLKRSRKSIARIIALKTVS